MGESCGGKPVWPSWQVALNAAILALWSGQPGVSPYRCRYDPSHWHTRCAGEGADLRRVEREAALVPQGW